MTASFSRLLRVAGLLFALSGYLASAQEEVPVQDSPAVAQPLVSPELLPTQKWDGNGIPIEPTAETDPNQPAIKDGEELEGGQMAMSMGGGSEGAGGGGGGLGGFGGPLGFQADPFSGRFIYTVPLLVPPARQGAQPTLNLSYSSGGGNGWCGLGWSLEIGYVERETKWGPPIKWSGTASLYEYQDTNGFNLVLAGTPMKLVFIGTEGGTGYGIYRPETETAFLTIRRDTTLNRWLVRDKGANEFIFGGTVDSVLENTKWHTSGGTLAPANKSFRWSLRSVKDVNGNSTTVSYVKDSGMQYPDLITYNGNANSPAVSETHSVRFYTDDTSRADKVFSYRGGFKAELRRRLYKVEMKVGTSLVRQYLLSYLTSTSSKRSLLDQVQLVGTSGVVSADLPPVKFTYTVKPTTFGSLADWGTLNPASTVDEASITSKTDDSSFDLLDLDSDGLPDRVRKVESIFETGATCNGTLEPKTQYEYYYSWKFQPNTGAGFGTENTYESEVPIAFYPAGTGCYLRRAGPWAGFFASGAPSTYAALYDMDGDGRLDRVVRQGTAVPGSGDTIYGKFRSFRNLGNGLDSNQQLWTIDAQGQTTSPEWNSMAYTYADANGTYTYVDLLDLNGDGRPDRVMAPVSGTQDHFKVQLSTGAAFQSAVKWTNTQTHALLRNTYGNSESTTTCTLVDMNGDGLPDRVFQGPANYTYFTIQFNNGAGFEGPVNWNIQSSGGVSWTNAPWAAPHANSAAGATYCSLMDINGDGLPDRVISPVSPYNYVAVQINRGDGFESLGNWTGWADVQSTFAWNSIGTSDPTTKTTYARMVDINGDGLLDRVLRNPNTGQWNKWRVQLNNGPVPDLLEKAENGIGGSVLAVYEPSTVFSHTNNAGLNLLPFPMHVVTSVSVSGGFAPASTTSYDYFGGFWESLSREFRGFHRVVVTDPTGNQSVTYFHQGGGYDGSSYGETSDSVGKKGIPFRVERWSSDAKKHSVTLNKVEADSLEGGLVSFPYIKQTIQREYPNGDTAYQGRATAQEMWYDNTTGNVTTSRNHGEVVLVNEASHTFNTGAGAYDLWTLTTYTNFNSSAGYPIRNKPASVLVSTTNSAAGRLRETQFTYGANGNLLETRMWLNPGNTFLLTQKTTYDNVGNPTETADAASVTNKFYYDSSRTFAEYKVTGSFTNNVNTFTNRTQYDALSGAATNTLDANGLAAAVKLDQFLRPIEALVSTNLNAAADQWRTRTYYGLKGAAGGLSTNVVRVENYEPADTGGGSMVVGLTFLDGLGRTVQTRAESETNNVYRVADAIYDAAGRAFLNVQPYFSTGTNYTAITGSKLAAYQVFDAAGRPWRTIPLALAAPTNGYFAAFPATQDSGSPVGTNEVRYAISNDPWITESVDPEGKVRRSYLDEWGRVTQIGEFLGGTQYFTRYGYDPTGNLTNTVDALSNTNSMAYDSLGRKTSMTDKDMGTWSYTYDAAGRLTEQVDARNNKIRLYYVDPLSRLTHKVILVSAVVVATNRFIYDVNSYNGKTSSYVPKGTLFLMEDREGWAKSDYDVRGRVKSATRYLTKNSTTYTTATTYDDASRVKALSYPGGVVTLNHTYNSVGALIRVEADSCSVSGGEMFYRANSFNEFGQLTEATLGQAGSGQAGMKQTYEFYANSRRLKQLKVFQPASSSARHLDLTYTFDTVSNVKGITDGLHGTGTHTGAGSGSRSSLAYDDFHRLTSATYVGTGLTKSFTYSVIGNTLTYGDTGTGTYTYGSSRPHAVTSANGKSYSYDANGNMTLRGSDELTYDEENRLIEYIGLSADTYYGYAEGGERLWKQRNNELTVYIGGIYEERNGQKLCHVFAGGKRIATFQQANGPLCWIGLPRSWDFQLSKLGEAATWPLREGRTPITAAITTLLGLLCVFAWGRQGRAGVPSASAPIPGATWLLPLLARIPLFRDALAEWLTEPATEREARQTILRWRHSWRPAAFWQQFVTVLTILALMVAQTPAHAEASLPNNVFVYYLTDHLGSSNVLTDRAGTEVQHFENGVFGKQTYQSNGTYSLSGRYTGQTFDEETGLYYYGARYYDPEIGRFTSADTIVQEPGDSQTFNRYSYTANNPIKYTDPSGNVFGFDDLIAAIVIGAVVGGAVAGATGGDVGKGALSGAIGGLFSGVGILTGGELATSLGMVGEAAKPIISAFGAMGGAAGGAASAAIQGGNIGMGAIVGGITGAFFGYLDPPQVEFSVGAYYDRTTGTWYRVYGDGTMGPINGGVGATTANSPASTPAGLTPGQAAVGSSGALAAYQGVITFSGQQLGDAGAVRGRYDSAVVALDASDKAGRTAIKESLRRDTPTTVRRAIESLRPGTGPKPNSVASANRANPLVSQLGKTFRILGRSLVVVSLMVDAARLAVANNTARELVKIGSGTLGAVGGGVAGALVGVGFASAATGIVGAAAGGYLGERLGDYVFTRIWGAD